MKKILILAVFGFLTSLMSFGQDTTVVQTLTYDSTGRSYFFTFPDGSTQYRKIIMQYNMRCKDGLVSTQGAPNDNGCGEWDYSCNTYIIDTNKVDSTKAVHPSHLISSFSGTTYNYTTQPTYTYYQSDQEEVVITGTNSETIGDIGAGSNNIDYPFHNVTGNAKVQYLVTEAELTGSGLIGGDITGLKLDLSSLGDDLNNLRINVKHTTKTMLDPADPDVDGFTNAYYLSTTPAAGLQQYNFSNYFTWNGTDNIIVEFTFDNSAGTSSDVVSATIANMGIAATADDFSIEFTGSNNIALDQAPANITNEISIAFWAYGNDVFSSNTTVCEGEDASGNRQVNIHFPWSNGRVYWDCGNAGSGYDRIDKAANMEDVQGQWNHWAFTKNATTGTMNIYLNGTLWHTGTGKTNPITLDNFFIGSGANSNYYYSGKIDEFSVWNKELDAVTIADWMYKTIDGTHPDYANLQAYYDFNEGTGTVLNGLAGGIDATLQNAPIWRQKSGKEFNHAFTALTERPNLDIIQGDYTFSVNQTTVLDSVINGQNEVREYTVNGSDLELVSTTNYYQAGLMPIYNELGTQVGTVNAPVEGTINITDLDYYNKNDYRFEIMSFVTPYGLYLDLGPEGKTWEFDLTDYAPILRGEKQLLMANGGQYQEQMDIKFLFIEGTPPRDVIDVKSVWRPGHGRNYTQLMDDRYFEPRDVSVPSNATAHKVRVMVTGHGQEGEFIPRTHYINVNGGSNEVEWQAWTECSENPIYPQGGTWVYDRAGWCPGQASDLLEYELDPSAISNDMVNLDYGVTSGSGDSRYLTSFQLVSYGDPNFANDASIYEIKNPTTDPKYGRFNPACQKPSIIIQNTGSEELTSLKIYCYMVGGYIHEQDWTGSLSFLETEEVVLNVPTNMYFWIGDGSNTFKASIDLPNGVADENADNNSLTSTVLIPDNFNQNEFKIRLRTNNMANHNSWKLFDASGAEIYSRELTASNTTYDDTVNLADGCYMLEVYDSGQDGLQWWANSAQGSGYIRFLTLSNSSLKSFENDFGAYMRYSFTVGGTLDYEEYEVEKFSAEIFPNPATDNVSVKIEGQLGEKTAIKIFDALGKVHYFETVSSGNNPYYYGSINLSDIATGEYFVEIKSGEHVKVEKLIIK